MNISNSSTYLFHNVTEEESNVFYFLNVLFGLPINSYVIWLIVTGTGNGLAAEFFSLNLAVCEILICVESVFLFLVTKYQILWKVVCILDGFGTTGRPLFQSLICFERYLAVVHPVTFLKYKPLRYRVICCVIGWVATFVSSGIITIFFNSFFYFVFLLEQFFTFLSIQLFCLVAVLRALKQSGPGERRGEREEENNMKKRAFYLILITTVTMLIMYAPYLLSMFFLESAENPDTVLSIGFVFFIFAGLVQSILFLYRVRKLPFFRYQ